MLQEKRLTKRILPIKYNYKRLNEMFLTKQQAKEQIQREIDKTDKEINEIVYKLCNITDEEKKIIEESK